MSTKLRISEIFYSLQGETSRSGLPTVFVRLTGCPLRCVWCDTSHAFTGGESLAMQEILDRVAGFGAHYVCVTGGEPLAQKACPVLLKALCDAGYSVSLETSGALDISDADERVSCILDLKAPGSGEESKNLWDNLGRLTPRDEIKLVLADERDYAWAKNLLLERHLDDICPVIMAPVEGSLPPRQLAEWILHDRLPVRMQIQFHKILWGEERGR
jgi:7-carboxy-7-deazaguanine synthase